MIMTLEPRMSGFASFDPIRSSIAGEGQELAFDAPRRIIGRSTTVAET
jgi:hypothetical protein